jgi:hypothetical protein
MRKLIISLCMGAMAATSVGCSYGAMASHNGKLYVAKNDGLLFGALRAVYECSPDGSGNMACVKVADKP